jgi:hypothetical protein
MAPPVGLVLHCCPHFPGHLKGPRVNVVIPERSLLCRGLKGDVRFGMGGGRELAAHRDPGGLASNGFGHALSVCGQHAER